jgi:hypothetical protein
MTGTIRIAIAAAVVFGAATATLAGSPEGVRAISPTVPLQGMEQTTTTPRTDVHVPPTSSRDGPLRQRSRRNGGGCRRTSASCIRSSLSAKAGRGCRAPAGPDAGGCGPRDMTPCPTT